MEIYTHVSSVRIYPRRGNVQLVFANGWIKTFSIKPEAIQIVRGNDIGLMVKKTVTSIHSGASELLQVWFGKSNDCDVMYIQNR